MAIAGLHLTEQEQTALETMAQRLGKTPDELVHNAVKQLIAQFQSEDPESAAASSRHVERPDRSPLTGRLTPRMGPAD